MEILPITMFAVVIATFAYSYYRQKIKIKRAENVIREAAISDPLFWNRDEMLKRVSGVFFLFKKDLNSLSLEDTGDYLSRQYRRRLSLIMKSLENQGKRLDIGNYKITKITFVGAYHGLNEGEDNFTVMLESYYHQSLVDAKSGKQLFFSSSLLNNSQEFWNFVRENGEWKLNSIRGFEQDEPNKEILDFASKRSFCYEPFYGWTTIPRQGKIFSNLINFDNKNCDSSHIIGLCDKQLVEIYRLRGEYFNKNILSRESKKIRYIIAQTILPKNYGNIVILKNRKFIRINFSLGDLKRIETESVGFNEKYLLWAQEGDGANSFELLTPDFMQKIMEMPFDFNMEITENLLYVFTEEKEGIAYKNMLDMLMVAYEEMKK